MTNFRITFRKINSNGIDVILFTTKVLSKSMRGAKKRARNLEPFTWDKCEIYNIDNVNRAYLDHLEFNQ